MFFITCNDCGKQIECSEAVAQIEKQYPGSFCCIDCANFHEPDYDELMEDEVEHEEHDWSFVNNP